MKKIACNAIGGPADCTHVVSADTEDAAIEQWHAHFGEHYKEIVENATEEEKKKWMEMHHGVWETASEE